MKKYYKIVISGIIYPEMKSSVSEAIDYAKQILQNMEEGTTANIVRCEDIGICVARVSYV